MVDPLESIAAEAETGATPTPDGGGLEPRPPTVGDRVLELFKPCPENALEKKGFISHTVNGYLAKRTGVPEERITVGENLAHCVDHLFPGGSSGLPPILGLAKSLLELRTEVRKIPDNGPTVRA